MTMREDVCVLHSSLTGPACEINSENIELI
jgi:hypothetical protein